MREEDGAQAGRQCIGRATGGADGTVSSGPGGSDGGGGVPGQKFAEVHLICSLNSHTQCVVQKSRVYSSQGLWHARPALARYRL